VSELPAYIAAQVAGAILISGCHLNPAVSAGLAAGKRFPVSELPAYIAAQVAGAILGAGVLYGIAGGKVGFDLSAGFASNGYGVHQRKT
jgi:aquaporin Z